MGTSDSIDSFDRALNAAVSMARETDIPVAAAVGTLVMKAFALMVDAYGIARSGESDDDDSPAT